jgi:hypothetical protein
VLPVAVTPTLASAVPPTANDTLPVGVFVPVVAFTAAVRTVEAL